MKPHTRIARVTSLFAASAALIVVVASVHPRGWPVAAFAAAAPQQITRLSFEAEFPAASVGRPYMQSLRASGGTGGYRFAEDGELPPGMHWVPVGDGLLLRGTPTKLGEYPLRILVNDADGQQITRDVTFKVTPDSNPAAVPVTVNETLTTTDAVSVLLPVVVNVNESLTTTDAVSVLLPLVVNVNETLTTTDTVSPVAVASTSASLTPTSQDFGSAPIGFFSPSSQQTFTLTNTGQTVLTSTAVTVTGTNVSSFQVAGNGCIASLAVDSNCSIYVLFEPAATGPLTATLNVISTGSTGTVTQTSSLTGTGLPGPTLTVIPNPVSFPTTSVNTTAAPITVTLTNTGNGQLGLNGTQVGTLGGADASHFTFSAGNCGYSGLATGASCSGSVTFTPNAARTFNATLSIPSNDGHSPAVIPLTGTGGTAPTATLTPATYDYGAVTVGSSTTNVFTLTNMGTAALSLSSPTVTGPYSISANACISSLAVNGTCTITVAFAPTTPGTTNGTLTVTDTTGDNFTASLTGTGAAQATPPVITVPANITVAATSASGAVVTYTATATDAVDGTDPVVCAPASGSTFPIATTTVNCSATDSHGNRSTASFTVTVQDTTPPVITVPANITVAATSASGALVTYTATATDVVDGTDPVVCAPASGSTFVLGTTTVSCSATDSHGNQSRASFTVTVQDTTPPVITVPANITVAATSASGAVVTYTATATDAVDGTDPVVCAPASGSTFVLGTTTVSCSATDSHDNQSRASFTVTVQDTTPPVITVPANITVAATSASGALVTYTATATDVVDGTDPVVCAPASGSTFPIATTTVNCSATDSHGNQSRASFTVTVQDTTPPVITVPANITVAATSASGAVVTYTATATDAVDGTDPVVCAPASGSTFVLGTTTVSCSATDSHGNQTRASFTVTVQDTTPPVITVPANITVAATSASGAVVTYTATATDAVDGTDPVVCAPASGSTFGIGTTTVSCSATDAAHNTSTASFTVTVRATPYVFVANSSGSVSSLYSNGTVQSSAVAGGGIGAAVDRNGLVFSITADGTGVSTFNDDGTLANTTSGVLTGASALAIDGADQLWIAAPGMVSMGQILGSGQASYTDPTLLKPSGMAIDISGNVWISDYQSNTVHEVVGGAAPVLPVANAVQTNTLGVEP